MSLSIIKVYFFVLALFFSGSVLAQYNTTHKLQNSYLQQLYEKNSRAKNLSVDYHLQPILNNAEQIELDSTLKNIFQIKPQQIVKKSNFFKSIFRDGNLLQTISSDKKNTFTINPLYNLEVGKATSKSVYQLNKGVRLDINLNNKVFISSSFYENLSNFPNYINQYIDSLTVVPGMGKARYVFNNIEYSLPLGYIGYKATEIFYFELGNDKNFIGNGHRSLLLSDVAYS